MEPGLYISPVWALKHPPLLYSKGGARAIYCIVYIPCLGPEAPPSSVFQGGARAIYISKGGARAIYIPCLGPESDTLIVIWHGCQPMWGEGDQLYHSWDWGTNNTTPGTGGFFSLSRTLHVFRNMHLSNTWANDKKFNIFNFQGWDFAQRFSERIARFLPKNERMSNSLKKQVFHSFAHFCE